MLYCSICCTSFFNLNPKQAAKRNVFNLTLFFNSSTSDSKSESLVSKVAYCVAKEPAEQLLMVVVVRSRQTKTTLLKPIFDQSDFFFFNDLFPLSSKYSSDSVKRLILWRLHTQPFIKALLPSRNPGTQAAVFTEKGHRWKVIPVLILRSDRKSRRKGLT